MRHRRVKGMWKPLKKKIGTFRVFLRGRRGNLITVEGNMVLRRVEYLIDLLTERFIQKEGKYVGGNRFAGYRGVSSRTN